MKKTFWLLPFLLGACHLETRLDGGNMVEEISKERAQSCIYVGSVFGYSVDELNNSTEEQMKTSALNSLKNTVALREANAVLITKHQSNLKEKNVNQLRYTIYGDAYICQ